jgi:hypothetical protein
METAQMPKGTSSTNTTKSMQISVPYPSSTELRLRISVGACRLRVMPTEGNQGEAWVTGRYYDGPIEVLPLEISSIGGEVRISQRQEWAEVGHIFEGPPTLELFVGNAKPYALAIETGANDSYLSLGGLPLSHYSLKQGAGKVVADFALPNPAQLDRIVVSSGASHIEMRNLANANFSEMVVEGGAASYDLDFGGFLRRDANVRLTAAMSSADITVPPSIAAKIAAQLIMAGCNINETFVKKDGGYWNDLAINGGQPTLYLQAALTMGSLNVHSR